MAAMAEIDRYEGKRYRRETVRVHTGHGVVEAQAYLVTTESMRKQFGDRFHVNLIHELWLRKRIRQFLKKHTRPGDRTPDAELERQAERELLATTERDLVMAHYRRDAVSDYYLERELDRPRPSIKHLYDDPQAQPYIRNYLALVIRQVLLNQFEEQMESRFRFELEHMRTSLRYFARSVGLVACLAILNANSNVVEPIIQKCLDAMPYEKNDLIDYVKYAVRAVKSIFDPRVAEDYLNRIRANLQPGMVPLGCELELSNLGDAAVEPLRSADERRRHRLRWLQVLLRFSPGRSVLEAGRLHRRPQRLQRSSPPAGILRDRPGPAQRRGRAVPTGDRRSLAAQPSDPRHDLISSRSARTACTCRSRCERRQIGHQRILPLGFVQCLLALGGGLERRPGGDVDLADLQGRDRPEHVRRGTGLREDQPAELVSRRRRRCRGQAARRRR